MQLKNKMTIMMIYYHWIPILMEINNLISYMKRTMKITNMLRLIILIKRKWMISLNKIIVLLMIRMMKLKEIIIKKD